MKAAASKRPDNRSRRTGQGGARVVRYTGQRVTVALAFSKSGSRRRGPIRPGERNFFSAQGLFQDAREPLGVVLSRDARHGIPAAAIASAVLGPTA
ncbi:MAG: hypothetical protein IPK56_11065 [Elusimicrobia bacterium]|nr:hypothetical protein [Elusimicrobiota bacterium]